MRIFSFEFLKQLGVSLCVFFIFSGAFINAYETTEEVAGAIYGTVGSVQDNYIAVVYNSAKKGIELEIGFEKIPDIKLIHKHRWDQIKKGEEVLARYVEVRRIKEGKADSGEMKREVTVVTRRLVSLEFNESEKRQLISGV